MINVYYNNKKIEKEGQFLTPEETALQPVISFLPLKPLNTNNSNYYTLILYDPNSVRAPNYVHWTVINIILNKNNMIFIGNQINDDVNQGNNLIQYQGPSPPVNSGTHNYTFLMYKQDKIYGPEFIRSIDTNNRNYKYLMDKLNLNSNNKLISKTYFTSRYTGETGGKKIVKERYNFKQRKTIKKQKKINKTIKNKKKQ
jgi:phosphatidylethanolamine-binding protein (PEBP) family uncharacterized protein